MYIIYVYDHNTEKWEYQEVLFEYLAARIWAGFAALAGYDALFVNARNSKFYYFYTD
jgi:hypothetical protein